MAELFILALLGHLVGDFVLQPKKMALGKSSVGLHGAILCTLHVCIYTAMIAVFWQTASPLVWIAVFVPHWIIDRWSLASVWLNLIRGRTFEGAHTNATEYKDFDVAFTAVVYTGVDNTFHLLCLWGLIPFLH